MAGWRDRKGQFGRFCFYMTYGGVLGVGVVFIGSFRMKVLDLRVVRPVFDDIFECI